MGDAERESSSDGVLVLTQGEVAPVQGPAELTLEDGTSVLVERQLPSDLPIGYHRLSDSDEKVAPVRVIVSPNWSVALPLLLEELESAPLAESVARILDRHTNHSS